jgi:hypothetical protein
MAYFAKLNSENVVVHVSAVADSDCLDSDGNESEAVGVAYLKSIHGSDTVWKQTSYNTKNNTHKTNGTAFRGNYAGIGFTYSESEDCFIPPKPFPSFVWDSTNKKWDPPVAYPSEGRHTWDEENQTWVAYPSE